MAKREMSQEQKDAMETGRHKATLLKRGINPREMDLATLRVQVEASKPAEKEKVEKPAVLKAPKEQTVTMTAAELQRMLDARDQKLRAELSNRSTTALPQGLQSEPVEIPIPQERYREQAKTYQCPRKGIIIFPYRDLNGKWRTPPNGMPQLPFTPDSDARVVITADGRQVQVIISEYKSHDPEMDKFLEDSPQFRTGIIAHILTDAQVSAAASLQRAGYNFLAHYRSMSQGKLWQEANRLEVPILEDMDDLAYMCAQKASENALAEKASQHIKEVRERSHIAAMAE